MLAEIDQIPGDYAKRRYYEALIKQANLDANALRDVLRQVARNISSDYEQTQLLIGVAPMLTGKEQAIQPFFDAVATIKSDYEHSRVLKTLLKQGTPSRAVLVLVAASTKNITSDYEAGVLSVPLFTRRTDAREDRQISRAEYERALARNVKKCCDCCSISRFVSDYEKATFLVEISNVYTGDTRLRSAFLKAVETIKSDYERGRVLSTLLKNKQIG